MGFFRRQALLTGLVANALRPLPGFRTGIPAFFFGMAAGELAPHLVGLTVADAAAHATGARRDSRGLALAGANLVGLAWLIHQSRQVAPAVQEALEEGLGVGYADELEVAPTAADLAVPWRRIAQPFHRTLPGVQIERDIAYADPATHGRRGLLDVYRPAGDLRHDAPVLLQVHGGAWTLGSKNDQGVPLMLHMAAKGWVCVALNYRLAPRDLWPAQVVDVKRVIAWVKEHAAAYGGDPAYLAITGGSAGGHLAALAALTPGDPAFQPGFEDADTRVDAAVPHYGVYDLAGASGLRRAELMRDRFLAPRIFRKRWSEHPEVFEAATPLLRVTDEAPDFCVVHGTSDTMVPVEQARLFVERLHEVSRRAVVYAELPGAQHAFDVLPTLRSVAVVQGIDRFLSWHHDRHVRARRAAGTRDAG